MSLVTRAEIERITRLANVDVDHDSLTELTVQIAQILEYFAQLSAVEGESQTDLDHDVTSPSSSFRDDVLRKPQPAINPKAFAPRFDDHLFAVPRLRSAEDE